MDRRQFIMGAGLLGLSALLPRGVRAMGEESRFTIARLDYGPGANPRPSALRRMLLEVEKRTSIAVKAEVPSVAPDDRRLFEHPFLALSGDQALGPLSPEAVENLRLYLNSGGFLFVDSAEGVSDGPFAQSVERELARIVPDKKVADLPKDHVLFKSFYLIDEPVGRVAIAQRMKAVFAEDRLMAVISYNDLSGAWARDSFGNWEYAVSPGGERQREMAFRLGINLVMYALCINYKADQVHVPFILKRRQWKVD